MALINVNNKDYSGNNINISNGKVFIDGKNVTPEEKDIRIAINGNVTYLQVDSCETVDVKGNIDKLRTGSGEVYCDAIVGTVVTGSGDVDANEIGGSVTTGSGDVDASVIHGNIKTGSGDVSYVKRG